MDAHITRKFHYSFRWNFWGSVFYEALKIVHSMLLLRLIGAQLFGVVGSVFAVMYLASKLADLGMSHSLAPFFHIIKKNKYSFRYLLLRYYLLPRIPFVIGAALLASWFYEARFSIQYSLICLALISFIVIFETIRNFFRYFLHLALESKRIVVIELFSYGVYLAIIWISFIFRSAAPSLETILIAHALDSCAVTTIFIFLIKRYYRLLPQEPVDGRYWEDISVKKRLSEAFFFNYIVRMSRELFTKHFLTPLFALRFGLFNAGLFFFAGSIATSLQSILRVVIGYSGYTLYAQVRLESTENKRKAFAVMNQKLITLLLPVIICILINHQAIISFGERSSTNGLTVSLLLLFLVVIFTEFFLMLYEQFYIIEEATRKLFFFKVIEFALFYALVFVPHDNSMTQTLINIIVIRLASIAIVSIDAYLCWKIVPQLRMRKRYLLIALFGSLLIYWATSSSKILFQFL